MLSSLIHHVKGHIESPETEVNPDYRCFLFFPSFIFCFLSLSSPYCSPLFIFSTLYFHPILEFHSANIWYKSKLNKTKRRWDERKQQNNRTRSEDVPYDHPCLIIASRWIWLVVGTDVGRARRKTSLSVNSRNFLLTCWIYFYQHLYRDEKN